MLLILAPHSHRWSTMDSRKSSSLMIRSSLQLLLLVATACCAASTAAPLVFVGFIFRVSHGCSGICFSGAFSLARHICGSPLCLIRAWDWPQSANLGAPLNNADSARSVLLVLCDRSHSTHGHGCVVLAHGSLLNPVHSLDVGAE